MSNNPYISGDNNANFICKTNGDIVINKVESPIRNQNKKAGSRRNIFSEPYYLYRKWHPSQLRGYVTDEFRSIKFTG